MKGSAVTMNHSWCQLLANSEYHHGKWQLPHHQPTYEQQLDKALEQLYLAAKDAVAVFNHYSPPEAHITLMSGRATDAKQGFGLLRYATQIRLSYEAPHLLMSLIKTESYQPKQQAMVQLLSCLDDLHEITWHTPDGHIWDQGQLIKSMLKELVRYSHPSA